MASLAPPIGWTASAQTVRRRVSLALEKEARKARRPSLRLLVAELSYVAEPVLQRVRDLADPYVLPKTHEPQTVMLVPGFLSHPVRMRRMAHKLEQAGHKVKRWGQGMNTGVSEDRLRLAEQRLVDLHRRYGRKVWLVGWSLGGLYAREIAKLQPDLVAGVITMGSPFSGDLRANNAWRVYQLVAGHRVDQVPVEARLAEKPPVPTIALWSPRDGVIDPRCAAGRPGERDRAVALRCSHMDFAFSRTAIRAVARELDRS
ncbi:alpha/beta hydrolase [Erythrobacter sp. 3-20A1M]|uniref:alpha/beta hydrolase family protein n=1 Tax=Erythrobacter sp. 3-20A1M TaxID=2653850 RepID=UPI001BFC177A|nr:alpha/beta hydrolase [Erythrobacter sp. 3-20A1M]QWC56090.1 alpha/beta hydrolase [Erythrobacter sp. 3-20A1M]